MNPADPENAAATVPLTLVAPGRPVRLVRVEGGQTLRNRLSSIGLVAGSHLEVISGSLHGPLVVAVDRTRVMLGQGIAHKVRVIVV